MSSENSTLYVTKDIAYILKKYYRCIENNIKNYIKN